MPSNNSIVMGEEALARIRAWANGKFAQMLEVNKLISSASVAEYSDESPYSVGQGCKHNGVVYACKTAINTGEAWNPSHWDEVSLLALYTALQSGGGGDPSAISDATINALS